MAAFVRQLNAESLCSLTVCNRKHLGAFAEERLPAQCGNRPTRFVRCSSSFNEPYSRPRVKAPKRRALSRQPSLPPSLPLPTPTPPPKTSPPQPTPLHSTPTHSTVGQGEHAPKNTVPQQKHLDPSVLVREFARTGRPCARSPTQDPHGEVLRQSVTQRSPDWSNTRFRSRSCCRLLTVWPLPERPAGRAHRIFHAVPVLFFLPPICVCFLVQVCAFGHCLSVCSRAIRHARQ